MWNSMFFLFPYFQNWLIDSANERNFNIILSLAQISRWLDYNLSWVFKLSSEEHHGNSSLWIRDIAKLFYKLYLMSHAYSFSSFNLLYTILYRLFFYSFSQVYLTVEDLWNWVTCDSQNKRWYGFYIPWSICCSCCLFLALQC